MKSIEQRIYDLEKATQALQQNAYGAQAPDNIVPTPPEDLTIISDPPEGAILHESSAIRQPEELPAVQPGSALGNMVNGRPV